MAYDEQKIILEYQAGKLENFAQIYDIYAEKIYRFIYYRTHHKETAEDLTSQTFFKALNKITSFDSKKGTVNSWIYKIARNTVIDFYRGQKKDVDINSVWDLGDNQDIAKDIDVKNQLEKVKSYLKNLNAEQRDIVLMRIWDGLSYKEIASVLGKSEASCKMTFSRTMSALRKEIPFAILFLNLINY